MNKFIKSLTLFIVPLVIIISIIVFIDPYDVIRKEQNIKYRNLKFQISNSINRRLYKLQAFDNSKQTEVLILGDSRANSLDCDIFELETGKKTTNLAYGGGNIREIVETFWYVTNKSDELKEVYIGINFNLYNALNRDEHVVEALRIKESLISYLLSKYSIKSTFLILKSLATNVQIEIDKPPFTKSEFWNYQLNITAPRQYQEYKYPKQYYEDLKKISEYCSLHKIKLVYFIPPTSIELQDKIRQYDLEKENQKFIIDIKSLNGTTYNFDFPNELTKNKKNFSDPYHFNDSIGNIITKIIIGDSISAYTYSNIYTKM